MTVAVTLCTRRRPQMLKRCLESLLPQLSSRPGNSVLVVENDDAEKVRPLVEGIAGQYPDVAVRYLFEPRLGIPHARNCALENALGTDVDWIGFIDDDETIEPGWYDAMVSAAAALPEADVLNGPVLYKANDPMPPWKPKRRANGRQTGDVIKGFVATNNTLLRRQWIVQNAPELRFDERLKFSGSEDKAFFMTATSMGCKIRYVAEACVTEWVLSDRLTLEWLLADKSRVASNDVMRHRLAHGWGSAAFRFGPKAAGLYAEGLWHGMLGTEKNGVKGLKGKIRRARAAGFARSLFGLPEEFYKNISGH
ncbi:glycosyltransferase family 2 protein [Notoacmeibacter ruber]|nr:glycosyltransferase family 2 protein [Notoacmeibacter ruber]